MATDMETDSFYNLELLSALDGVAANDNEVLEFGEPAEPAASEQSLNLFRAFVNDGVIVPDTEHQPATRIMPASFEHTPYERRATQNKAPRVKSENRASKEASKLYRDRKKAEFANAQAQLVQANETIVGLRRELENRDALIRQLTADRDHWKTQALQGGGTPSLSGITRPSSTPAFASPPTPDLPAPTTGASRMLRGGPATTNISSPGSAASSLGVPPVVAPQMGSPEIPHLKQETLQLTYRRLQELVARPDSTDEELKACLRAILMLFYRRNYIAPEYVKEIITPEFLLRNVYLNPTEEDCTEEPPEVRYRELVIWSQILHRSGLTQEQFQHFVVVRQQFKAGMRRIMRERMGINAALRKFFITKIGYTRFMNMSDVNATADDVAGVAERLTQLQVNLKSVMQLRAWLLTNLEKVMTPRQYAICNLQVRQATVNTQVALSAVTGLLPPDETDHPDAEAAKRLAEGKWTIHA